MRVGLNLLYLIPGNSGTETYATSLIRALAEVDTNNEYVVFVNQESSSLRLVDHPNFQKVVCQVPARYQILRYFWEQAILPWQVAYLRIDVLHSMGYVSPLLLPCYSVVTIHDVNFRYIGNTFSALRRWAYKFLVPCSARTAAVVLTGSDTAKSQISREIGVPLEKIVVTHYAVEPRAASTDNTVSWGNLVEQHNVRKPYLLAMSSKSPHKNMNGLLRAFATLRRMLGQDCPQLVIVGHPPATNLKNSDIIDSVAIQENVVWTGFVPGNVLDAFYANAMLFVFPSLYEGFGIPVLEAMLHGVPVVCSEVASLPEVAGDAALYFDPHSVEDMATKMATVLQNTDLGECLVERGYRNLERFSWRDTAQKTIQAYIDSLERDMA